MDYSIPSFSFGKEREDGNEGLPYLEPDIKADDSSILPAGVYLGEILYTIPHRDKQRVDSVFEVKAGPYAGFFAGLPASQDWRHTVYLSFKPNALRFTKLALKAIGEANPGFDGFEAWNSDLREFEGRLAFVVASHRETIDSYGEPETLCSFRVASPAALKAGRYLVPGTQHADGTREPSAPGQPVDVGSLLAEARGENQPGIGLVGATDTDGDGLAGLQQSSPAIPNPLWGGSDA